MSRVVIVLPTYNEAENLPLMVNALLALPVENLTVLVVDDNSPDGTGALADQLAAQHPNRVRVAHRMMKAGLGQAYIHGFKEAIRMNADFVIQMDVDFSHDPKYIPQMIAHARQSDLVICSRYVKGGTVDESWSAFRKLLSWFANRVYLPFVLNVPIRDATGGFRLWRRHTLLGVDVDRIRSSGYIFQVETAYLAHKLGYRVTEIPIHFPDRQRGQSKMDVKIQIEAALRAFQLKFRYRFVTPRMRPAEGSAQKL